MNFFLYANAKHSSSNAIPSSFFSLKRLWKGIELHIFRVGHCIIDERQLMCTKNSFDSSGT